MKRSLLTKRSLALAAMLGALSLAPAIQAQTPPPAPPEAADHADPSRIAEHRLTHLTQALNLTADQQAALKPILADEAARDQKIFAAMRRNHEKYRAKISEVLTPEQKTKFDALAAKHDAKKAARQAKAADKS